MEKYGRIVCAALLNNDCIYMGREGHYIIFPMEPIGVLRCATQGFVTENGYFVERELGLQIATYYDQIEYKYNPLNQVVDIDKCLYMLSEDENEQVAKVRKIGAKPKLYL